MWPELNGSAFVAVSDCFVTFSLLLGIMELPTESHGDQYVFKVNCE